MKDFILLLSPDGFERRFWKHTRTTNTYKKAYELTEQECETYFGRRHYSDYNSFRNCRDRKKATMLHIKNKR